MKKQIFAWLSVAALLGFSLTPQAAQAHHRSGHNGGPPSSRGAATQPSTDYDSEAVSLDDDILDATQRSLIEALLQDTNDTLIIDTRTRRDIQAQINSLPPGIQRRLARGRALPPGIAKKVNLPTRVNEHIGLEDNVQIVIVGRDAVVVDPVTGLIVDVLRQILL